LGSHGEVQVSVKGNAAARAQTWVYKELHAATFFSTQLPGRIVFDSRQLDFTRRTCEGKALLITVDRGTILEGSW